MEFKSTRATITIDYSIENDLEEQAEEICHLICSHIPNKLTDLTANKIADYYIHNMPHSYDVLKFTGKAVKRR